MQGLSRVLVLVAVATQGCASHAGERYLYFPDLANRAARGDAAALGEVLARADKTSPGEQMEELAEILGRSVRPFPAEFLRAQSNGQDCFGVDFLGPEHVDDEQSRRRERALRRKALASVTDPLLATARQRCLAVLDGN